MKSSKPFLMNIAAHMMAAEAISNAAKLRISATQSGQGATILDCGIKTPGGVAAGRLMAEVCLGGLGDVALAGVCPDLGLPMLSVSTDHPLQACMASQYAGWQISGKNYFAMGSGPMRAAGSAEKLFDEIGFREQPDHVVGVLETASAPTDEVCQQLSDACHVASENLTLLVAPTASLAGGVQIVARSVETAIHKLHELGFDLNRLVAGWGVAPLPPVAKNDMAAIGRTNDAVLYGGRVILSVTGDDDTLAELGKQTPSSASSDFGSPFAEIFKRYDRDFYKIDPMLFSPAQITLQNIETGRSHRFGETRPDILKKSFFDE